MMAGRARGKAAAGLVRALTVATSCLLLWAPTALAAPPANDDFVDALVGSGDHVEGAGNTFGATKESGEPSHAGDPGGASVWFAWTAPRSQTVYAQICTEGWKALLSIYRGESVDDLQPVAATQISSAPGSCGELSFRAISAVTYRIAVDGSTAGGAAEQGNFDFTVSSLPLKLPANDAFANATEVKSTPYEWIYGSTDGATREAGEPGHGGDLAGASVWYRWTAPTSGAMRIFPCKAGFRPTLAVYTGSTLATLHLIGAPATLAPSLTGECQLGGLGGVGFDAVASETYSIAVDGVDSGWGRFQLRLGPAWVPYVDVYPPNTYISKRLRLRRRGIAIRFGSGGGPPGDTFLCKLDRKKATYCRSPKRYRHLKPGRHRFKVWAIDAAGNKDPTPALARFKIPAKSKHRHARHVRHRRHKHSKRHRLALGRRHVAAVATDAPGNRNATPAVRTFRMGDRGRK